MQTGSYVNGHWYHPKSPRLVRNVNPADPDDVLAEFPAATAGDLDAASMRRAAFEAGRIPLARRRPRCGAGGLSRATGDELPHAHTRKGKCSKSQRGGMKGISMLEFSAWF